MPDPEGFQGGQGRTAQSIQDTGVAVFWTMAILITVILLAILT